MAISDSYIVQYLIQTTLAPNPASVWKEAEGTHRTTVRGVQVELDVVPSRAGERIFLTLTCDGYRACIAEPPDVGFLQQKFESEEKHALSNLMRELARGVTRQCAGRQLEAEEREEEARQWVFRRLLFEEDPLPAETTTNPRQVRLA